MSTAPVTRTWNARAIFTTRWRQATANLQGGKCVGVTPKIEKENYSPASTSENRTRASSSSRRGGSGHVQVQEDTHFPLGPWRRVQPLVPALQ